MKRIIFFALIAWVMPSSFCAGDHTHVPWTEGDYARLRARIESGEMSLPRRGDPAFASLTDKRNLEFLNDLTIAEHERLKRGNALFTEVRSSLGVYVARMSTTDNLEPEAIDVMLYMNQLLCRMEPVMLSSYERVKKISPSNAEVAVSVHRKTQTQYLLTCFVAHQSSKFSSESRERIAESFTELIAASRWTFTSDQAKHFSALIQKTIAKETNSKIVDSLKLAVQYCEPR